MMTPSSGSTLTPVCPDLAYSAKRAKQRLKEAAGERLLNRSKISMDEGHESRGPNHSEAPTEGAPVESAYHDVGASVADLCKAKMRLEKMAESGWSESARFQNELNTATVAIGALSNEILLLKSENHKLLTSKSSAEQHKLTGFFQRFFSPSSQSVAHDQADNSRSVNSDVEEPTYERWVRECDTLSPDDRLAIRRHINRFKYYPTVSVIMPVYDTSEQLLCEAIQSVVCQLYPLWELCIADDASPSPHVVEILRNYAGQDDRIKWVRRENNGHISAATNSALELATGEFVALMDHDDILPEHALYEVVNEINRYPNADLIYSDEDHVNREGRRSNAYFKTDWNREIMLGHNMISHFGIYRRSLLNGLGGMRIGFEGSQDYDLALRVADCTKPERIRHIPTVLYHWRQNAGENSFSESHLDRCVDAAHRAVVDSLVRQGEDAIVKPNSRLTSWHTVQRNLSDPLPLVSLIIPTKDKADLLSRCVNGILNRTDYTNIEIVIIDHESSEKATAKLFDDLRRDKRVRIIPYSGAFNYSAINNVGVKFCTGRYVGLVNNDIDVIEAGWLREMVSIAALPGTGAVGARLLYADGRIQHAGVVLGVGGVASHFCKYIDRDHVGYFGRAAMTSEVSAVTGACLIVKKAVFDEVGGLDEVNLPIAFNDVDFCLRVREKGYRNIYTPHAELYHLESASRGSDLRPDRIAGFQAEIDYMKERWADVLQIDPFFNVNFSLYSENFEIGFPPRRRKPWL